MEFLANGARSWPDKYDESGEVENRINTAWREV